MGIGPSPKVSAPIAAALACTALWACVPPPVHRSSGGPLRVISRLDCPNEADGLSLRSQSGDGASCEYQDDSGSSVILRLVFLNGADPQAVLRPIETALRAELPAAAAGAAGSGGGADNVDISLPGVHIHASDHGAQVGTAADAGASVSGGKGVRVDATDNGAQIRVRSQGAGFRSTFLLVSDLPGPHGYRFVGYQARGPASGPIVVAQMMGKDEDHGDLDDAVKGLLDRNVGR